jgi:hypothetical protein
MTLLFRLAYSQSKPITGGPQRWPRAVKEVANRRPDPPLLTRPRGVPGKHRRRPLSMLPMFLLKTMHHGRFLPDSGERSTCGHATSTSVMCAATPIPAQSPPSVVGSRAMIRWANTLLWLLIRSVDHDLSGWHLMSELQAINWELRAISHEP